MLSLLTQMTEKQWCQLMNEEVALETCFPHFVWGLTHQDSFSIERYANTVIFLWVTQILVHYAIASTFAKVYLTSKLYLTYYIL